MNFIGKVVCRTVGIAAMSAVAYDSYMEGQHHAASGAEEASADTFESIIAAQRTADSQSHITNAMQQKVADLRMSNPIITAFGKTKGFIKGALNSLADNFMPVAFASCALTGKGRWAKFGAWGIVGYSIYKIAKEGFGIGKKSPIDS